MSSNNTAGLSWFFHYTDASMGVKPAWIAGPEKTNRNRYQSGREVESKVEPEGILEMTLSCRD